MTFGIDPKNKKVSIHNKYKRRLKSLSFILTDFLFYAEQKLDRSQAGAIHHRADIEKIFEKSKELSELLPSIDELIDCGTVRGDFLDLIQQDSDSGNTQKILEDADDFFKSLSKEEWDEMISEYRQKDKK